MGKKAPAFALAIDQYHLCQLKDPPLIPSTNFTVRDYELLARMGADLEGRLRRLKDGELEHVPLRKFVDLVERVIVAEVNRHSGQTRARFMFVLMLMTVFQDGVLHDLLRIQVLKPVLARQYTLEDVFGSDPVVGLTTT